MEKILKCFLPYMGMVAILFNDADNELIDNTPSTDSPKAKQIEVLS